MSSTAVIIELLKAWVKNELINKIVQARTD